MDDNKPVAINKLINRLVNKKVGNSAGLDKFTCLFCRPAATQVHMRGSQSSDVQPLAASTEQICSAL